MPVRPLRRLAPVVTTAFLVFAGAAAAAIYPSPPFNFAHPGSPHDPLYSPTGGNTDRPMLVVYAQFSDVTFPGGIDAAAMATRFFGPFPSVAGYFADDSYGRLILGPAAETSTSGNGAANDGVVQVTVSSTKSAFIAMSEGDQNKALLQLADPFVNFAAFDTNGNGTLTDAEIVVERVDADPDPPGPAGCGATRGVSAVSLDGKNMGVSVAQDGTDSNLMTIIHETGHVAFHMRDLYGFGVGSFDISGPTCGAADSVLFRTSSWQKLHLNWITPAVVDKDGFYTVPRSAPTGSAFLLYDPDRGTNDYFLAENRTPIPNSYDRNASDNGLVIWRIDDAQYNSGSESVRPIDIMRPDGTTVPGCPSGCYGGSAQDAWNPSDSSTPQRTMTRTWRDGAAAGVAVRAIGAPNAVTGSIRAYFDVRGPGVLVDPYTLDVGGPVDVTPDEANAFSIPVMNTGEATDTFDFTFTGLPAGWTASTATLTLGAGIGSTAAITLTPDANAATGVYTITVRGTSTTDGTVTSTCPVRVNVVLDRTQIDYTGDTSQPFGEPAGFAALVRDIDDGLSPVVGAPVTFALAGPGGTQSATATTNGSGIATANPILTVLPGSYTLTVSTPRVGKHAPASISLGYTVERRPTTIVYTGVHAAEYSDPAAVRAVLTDTLSGTPLAGKLISFALGTQSGSGTTDGLGVASDTIVLTQAAATVNVTASFAGDTIYLPSSDTDSFVIDEEDLTFVYTGDTLVASGTTPILRSQATQEADGFPGDLSLAQAQFTLTPTLTLVPFTYTTGVSAAGTSSTPAAGLPVDLWTVTIAVPAGNGYWEGASVAPAELVVFDPAGQVTGGARGPDSAGNTAQVEVTARYQGTSPKGQVQLRTSAGRFKGSAFDWIVVVGHDAILQVGGDLDGAPASLRLRVHDAGEPSTSDTFRAMLGGYNSGVVTVRNGNLQVR